MARLRVAGSRAVPRLLLLLQSDAPPAVRAGALCALDGLDDPRAIDAALSALGDAAADVAAAAAGVLRGWVAREEGTRVLDALAGVALDQERAPHVRLAALDALRDLPAELVRPLLAQAPPVDPRAIADDPEQVLEWVRADGSTAPLSTLHDLVVRSGGRERETLPADARAHWQRVRGAVHAALAARGSRVALYDLKEALEAGAGPLPNDFVTAIASIGDASCLEPLARAWSASSGDTWWQERLAGAAAAIVRRARLSGRSAVVKRVRARWPGFL